MDHDIQVLLQALEEEKIRLRYLINDCLKEEEYLMAHYHSEALFRINSQLNILKQMDDKFFYEKSIVGRRIKSYQNLENNAGSESYKIYYRQRIDEESRELDKLTELSEKQEPGEVGFELKNALSELVNGKLSRVKLILLSKANFVINFTVLQREFKIAIPFLQQHIDDNILYDGTLDQLEQYGFVRSVHNNEVYKIISMDASAVLAEVELLLIKIMFECFHYREFENETYLEIFS